MPKEQLQEPAEIRMLTVIDRFPDAYMVYQDDCHLIGVFSGPAAAMQHIVGTVDFFHRKDYTVRCGHFQSTGQMVPLGKSFRGDDQQWWQAADRVFYNLISLDSFYAEETVSG